MGHIVKAKRAPDGGAREQGAASAAEHAAGDVTEVLLAARLFAERERMAAKNAAVILARKMAEKIVGRAVDLDPAVMADIASQALHASGARGSSVVLRIHPEDLPAVAERKPRWLGGEDSPAEVRIVADASVGRYGCVVETQVGRLDARLQTQLDVLERVLGGTLAPAG
jgi:flagellar biosynthesis/type III secretory pathway protein FliH